MGWQYCCRWRWWWWWWWWWLCRPRGNSGYTDSVWTMLDWCRVTCFTTAAPSQSTFININDIKHNFGTHDTHCAWHYRYQFSLSWLHTHYHQLSYRHTCMYVMRLYVHVDDDSDGCVDDVIYDDRVVCMYSVHLHHESLESMMMMHFCFHWWMHMHDLSNSLLGRGWQWTSRCFHLPSLHSDMVS